VGSIVLPASGTVYVDTQVVIYSVERHPVYFPLIESRWRAAQAGTLTVVSSDLTLMECMVLPLRSGNIPLRDIYDQALRGTDLRLLPIDQTVLLEAAKIRALSSSVRTPDAIHRATAAVHRCSLLVTNDTGFRGMQGVPVVILQDLLSP
jgi:predicted nucleic acid-binding protein